MENDIIGINNPYAKLLPETIDNNIMKFATPKQIHSAYKLGYVNGVLLNTDKTPYAYRQFAKYNFDYLKANQEDNQSIIFEDTKYYGKIKGSSKGKRILQYKAGMEINPNIYKGSQLLGDCVSWAIRAALDTLRCLNIKNGKWEDYITRQATCGIYTGRGHNSDGADPVGLSAYAVKIGTLLEQVYKTDKNTYDFTDYKKYANWGASRGRSGMPADLLPLTKPYTAAGYKVIATTDGIADAMEAGCTVQMGSMLSFGDYGDPIAPRTREGWSHSMNIAGFDDTREFYKDRVWMIENSWGCHADDTEVLTNDGWKLFKDVKLGELVYTLNPESWNIEINSVQQLHKYDFNGELYHYKCQGVDQLVTDNHKLYIGPNYLNNTDPTKWSLQEVKNIDKKHFSMKKDGNWHGAHILAHEMEDGRKISMNVWLEFLGYYLSEGSVTYAKKAYTLSNGEIRHCNRYEVSISQKKLDNIPIFQQLLDKLPFNIKRNSQGWVIYDKGLWSELYKFGKCHQKFIPEYVWDCSQDQLNILFNALMLGDGSIGNGKENYYTSSERLAGDMQRLSLLCGFAADLHVFDRTNTKNTKGYNYNHKEYNLGIIRSFVRPAPKGGWIPEKQHYKGYVYCVGINNHIVYVRRNGKTCWSGNSWCKVVNIPEAWKPLPEGTMPVSESTAAYGINDGGTTVFIPGEWFKAQPISNSII